MPNIKSATLDFKAKNGISPMMKRAGLDTKKFGGTVDRVMSRASKRSRGFGATLKGVFAGNLLAQGTMRLQQGIYGVGEAFVGLDDSITRAGSKFPEKIERGTKAFYQLSDAAKEVGISTEFTMVEAGKGLDFLAMAGFNAKQSMAALPGLADLATVANTDLANASNIASDALTAFGMASKDPEEMARNLTRVSDVLSKTSNTANTDINMMFDALSYSGPVIKAAGQQIETFAAITGKMANASIKGSKAGTAMKNMFLRLQAPTPKATKAIRRLGVEAIDKTTGDMRDMVDVLGDMDKAMTGMGKAKKAQFMDAIFGKRAIVGVNALMEQGIDGLRKYRDELRAAGGTSKEVAENIRGSLLNRLQQLKSATTGKGMDIISAMLGDDPEAASKNLKDFIGEVRKFDVKPLAKTLKELLGITKSLFKFIYRNRDAIIAFGKAYIGLKVAMAGLSLGKAVYDWGLLAGNIGMAMRNAKGLGKLGAGLDAALGGTAGASKAGASGMGALMKSPLKSLSILGAVGGVVFAGAAGVAIGTALYEGIVGPSMDQHYDKQDKKAREVYKSGLKIKGGTDPSQMLVAPIQEHLKDVDRMLKGLTHGKIMQAKTIGANEFSAGAMMDNMFGAISEKFTGDYWSGIGGSDLRVVGEADRQYEKMVRQKEELLKQRETLTRRLSIAEVMEAKRNEQPQYSQELMPWEKAQQDQDQGNKTAFDATVAASRTRKDMEMNQLANLIGKAVNNRPIRIDVNVNDLPQGASVDASVSGAPTIDRSDLGGG